MTECIFFNNGDLVMAIKKKAKATVKGATHLKIVDSAIASINDVAAAAAKAVIATDKEYKKLAKTAKSINKKRASLMKKAKAATNKMKKDASATNKKVVVVIKKDIAAIKKEIAKHKSVKSAVAEELATLKSASKRAVAYAKVVAGADKALNKPKKKTRKKKPQIKDSRLVE